MNKRTVPFMMIWSLFLSVCLTGCMDLFEKERTDIITCYTVNIAECENGTVTLDKTKTAPGSIVTIASSAKEGYFLSSVSVKDADGDEVEVKDGRFIMPPGGVTVTAIFDEIFVYKFHNEVTLLAEGTEGSAGTSARYALFGDWPRSVKSEYVSIDETQSEQHGTFTYYKGSDGFWYAKCMEDANTDKYFYSDKTHVALAAEESEKYFKVEPIKWRILTDDYDTGGGIKKSLLLSEEVLTARRYDDDKNNYKDSEIRTWLNADFLTAAFTEDARSKIAQTTVDNSASSTVPVEVSGDDLTKKFNNGTNEYASENTEDKIFLLSLKEASTQDYFKKYSLEDKSRIRFVTDFAKANSAFSNSSDASCGGWWWLRSPYCLSSGTAHAAGDSGLAGFKTEPAGTRHGGIVPALCVTIE